MRGGLLFAVCSISITLASCGASSATAVTSPTTTSRPTTSPSQSTTTSTTLPSSTTSPSSTVQSPAVSGPVVLRGNGIGGAVFGQQEAAAISNLKKVLGPPTTASPRPSNNCTIDAFLQFPGLVTYFHLGKFVGYATGTENGENTQVLNVVTRKGLRIGDSLERAKKIYGTDFRTSYAQGGSWFAFTSTGTLAGYLTAEVNRASARIEDITAGSVGCPAASP